MPFNVLLLPLLGGFLLISRFNRFRFDSVRLDGYRLLLSASVAGAALFAIAKLVIVVFRIPLFTQPIIVYEALSVWRRMHSIDHLGASILAFLMGLILPGLLNRRFHTAYETDRAAQRKGDQLELFLREALAMGRTVLLTLKSGQLYLGILIRVSSPAVPLETIRLFCTQSGYREEKTKSIRFTNDYRKSIERQCDTYLFEIVIPVREIESVGLFDSDIAEFSATGLNGVEAVQRPGESDGCTDRSSEMETASSRRHAAVQLRVPASGDATIDAMIEESRRRDLELALLNENGRARRINHP